MNTKGLTLIELLFVFTFMAIFIGVSVSGFMRYQQTFKFSGEVNELVGDLRYAKQASITEQIQYGVRFNFFDNSYLLIRYEEGEKIIKNKQFSSEIKITRIDDFYEVRFTRFGAALSSGEFLIESKDFLKNIEIKPSGFIYVKRINFN